MVKIDSDAMYEAYEDVRNDNTPTSWATFKYDDKTVVLSQKGESYDDFLQEFSPEERVYGFVRLETGDELSKRAKFALITWVGHKVSVLKKAKVSTDKADVKKIIQSYAKEILADQLSEIQHRTVFQQVKAAGGANYGTGLRS